MKVVYGVGLVLIDNFGRILILRELQNKPHYGKRAGMLSFPIESIEEGETSLQALARLGKEEIGVEYGASIVHYQEFLIRLNDEFTENLDMYIGICNESFIPVPQDTDVEFYAWMLPDDVLALGDEQIRLEVRPVLGNYFRKWNIA